MRLVSAFLICIFISISQGASNSILDLKWSPEDCTNHKNMIRLTTPWFFSNTSVYVIATKYNSYGRARTFQNAIAFSNGTLLKSNQEWVYPWQINSTSNYKLIECEDEDEVLCLKENDREYSFRKNQFNSTLYHWVSGLRQLYNIDKNFELTVWDLPSSTLKSTQNLADIFSENEFLEGIVLHNTQILHIIIPFKDVNGSKCDIGGYYFTYDQEGIIALSQIPYVDSAFYDPLVGLFFVMNNNNSLVYEVEKIGNSYYSLMLLSNTSYNESQLIELMDQTAMKYWLGPLIAFIILWILVSIMAVKISSDSHIA